MEKLKNFTRLALATAVLSSGASACKSQGEYKFQVSNCSKVESFDGNFPIYGETAIPVNVEPKKDLKTVQSEVGLPPILYSLDASLFPENVDKPELTDKPSRLLSGGDFEVSANIPEYFKNELNMYLEDVNKFLPTERQIKQVDVYKLPQFGDGDATLGGRPRTDENGNNMIQLEVKPAAIFDLNEAERVVFHEGMHVVFEELGPGRNFGWGGESGDIWSELNKDVTKALDDGYEELKKRGFSQPDLAIDFIDGDVVLLNDLFHYVKESCYTGEGGHPKDNPDEMFASAATVMRFFPKSYLESIENLPNEKREKLERLSSYVLGQLMTFAPDREAAKAQFDAEIIERFLR